MSWNNLIQWSEQSYGHLPWRTRRSFYHTLVSEIMLQQTTVSTVLGKFDTFVQKFPTIEDLARASEEDVLIAWKGLGYYRRARHLKKAAESLATLPDLPLNVEELKKHKGIGGYTANALISIGLNRPGLAIDANLERVLARLLGLKILKGPKLHKEIFKKIEQGFLAKEFKQYGARAVHEAIMDLGRTCCQLRKVDCVLCPLKNECLANQRGEQLEIPVEMKKEKEEHALELLRFVVRDNGKILVYKKPAHTWLSGQFEVPTFIFKSSDERLKQYPRWRGDLPVGNKYEFKTSITKYKIKNSIYEIDKKLFFDLFPKAKGLLWKKENDDKSNLAVNVSKALKVIALY